MTKHIVIPLYSFMCKKAASQCCQVVLIAYCCLCIYMCVCYYKGSPHPHPLSPLLLREEEVLPLVATHGHEDETVMGCRTLHMNYTTFLSFVYTSITRRGLIYRNSASTMSDVVSIYRPPFPSIEAMRCSPLLFAGLRTSFMQLVHLASINSKQLQL